MPFGEPDGSRGWSATLALAFEARGDATLLARRRHEGPLVVQKALHPEGPRVCHAILVHPPSGICGGDTLDLRIDAGEGAHALVTTPGAGKWHRSLGAEAAQRVAIRAQAGAVVEWLPQDTIVYDGARARIAVDVALAGDASFVGLDVLCLGRTASGERFTRGRLSLETRVERDGHLVWIERGAIDGGGPLLESPIAMAGQPVVGTLLAASPRLDATVLARCRDVPMTAGRGACTLLPGLLIARWLGPACEPARNWLASVWAVLRPVVAGREAVAPRIWNT